MRLLGARLGNYNLSKSAAIFKIKFSLKVSTISEVMI